MFGEGEKKFVGQGPDLVTWMIRKGGVLKKHRKSKTGGGDQGKLPRGKKNAG